MRAWIPAILAAVALHAALLLFGGIFIPKPEKEAEAQIEEVELMASEEKEDEEPEEPQQAEERPPEEMKVEEERPPEMAEVIETAPRIEATDLVPRLDALSLAALEGALEPGAGADGFGGTASLASGGRIGGTGVHAPAAGKLDDPDALFDIGDLDQKPRILQQLPPTYPRELRQRKIEGTVTVVFVVDKDGRVVEPAVESSTHAAFQAPALEAIRRWRFDPAVVRGEKVRARMRIPIRFSASG